MSALDYRAPVNLETERLLMPPLSGRHTGALTEVYAAPDVARHEGGATLDADGTAAQVARFQALWREHGIGQSAPIDKASGAFLGRTGLHPWPQWDEVEPGHVLAQHAEGRGLATDAARAWLDVASREFGQCRLTAVVHPDNARAGRRPRGSVSASTARTEPRPVLLCWSMNSSTAGPAG